MVSTKKDSKPGEPKKVKKIKSAKELSAIAMKAVAKRQENHPEWGAKKREKDAAKKKEDKE